MQATMARSFAFSIAAHAALLSPIFYFAAPPRAQPDLSPMVLTLLDAPVAVEQRHTVPQLRAVHPSPHAPSLRSPHPASAPVAAHIAQEVETKSDAPAPPVNAATEESPPTAPIESISTTGISPSEHDASTQRDVVADHHASYTHAQQLANRVRDELAAYFSYPPLAKRAGWQGEVRVGLRVYADGRLSDIHLVTSSGHGILDRAALSSLAQVRHLDEGVDWLGNGHFDMVLPIHYHLIDG